ncbi:hypothetical protein E2562_011476 [Oryza meyeriana var. granulata]|uniref:Uncharacterized protein n=1 Tax=Oryza meyeriana var. granulata TaxID=110450 RepID=A0A6G1D1C6_9ORYZ|nr:hypothetical protein E2562_011476 [Oryza meyeriana var. granulata]
MTPAVRFCTRAGTRGSDAVVAPADGWGSDAAMMTIACRFMVLMRETVVAVENACRLVVLIQEAVVLTSGGGSDVAEPSDASRAADLMHEVAPVPLESCKPGELFQE